MVSIYILTTSKKCKSIGCKENYEKKENTFKYLFKVNQQKHLLQKNNYLGLIYLKWIKNYNEQNHRKV